MPLTRQPETISFIVSAGNNRDRAGANAHQIICPICPPRQQNMAKISIFWPFFFFFFFSFPLHAAPSPHFLLPTLENFEEFWRNTYWPLWLDIDVIRTVFYVRVTKGSHWASLLPRQKEVGRAQFSLTTPTFFQFFLFVLVPKIFREISKCFTTFPIDHHDKAFFFLFFCLSLNCQVA